jgi:alpha-tubulin suppressor-like RCC1 family protein
MTCWGGGSFGQLGNGRSSTTNDAYRTDTPVPVQGVTSATRISAGYDHTCAVLESGEITCWGLDNAGQLGSAVVDTVEDEEGRETPTRVSFITSATDAAAGSRHTCALLQSGAVRCWGDSALGRLGDKPAGRSGIREEPASRITFEP